MMKKIAVVLTFAAIGLLLAAGVQAETVRGEGRYMSNKLTHLMPFKAVEVRGDAEVDIWQRDMQSVTVSGKSNLVALADLRVENETLIIDFKRPVHVKGTHALHVAVSTMSLENITVHGQGRVRIRGSFDTPQLTLMAGNDASIDGDLLKADMLRVQATDKADVDLERMQVKKLEVGTFDKAEVELSGSAEQAQLINNSSKDLEASSLRVTDAHVQINGSGDVEIFATKTLKAEALGSGKITYHGRPMLTRSGSEKHIRPAFED